MHVFHKISRAETKSKLKSSAISIDLGQQTSEKSLAFEWEMRNKIKKKNSRWANVSIEDSQGKTHTQLN